MAQELPKELLDNTFWCSLIGLRREIHMHPEPGFQEVRTQQRVREVLVQFAKVPEAHIRTCAVTGLVVDIKGTGPPRLGVPVSCVALRSDLDALMMTEGNLLLPYRSRNEGCAHMCGHDGHIAALVGAAIFLQRATAKIPSNLTVRLLFQPAEEGSEPGTAGYNDSETGGGGAVPMIWDSCLEGVDEVYGWHNWPACNMGALLVKSGAVMSRVEDFEVTIRGQGGHGSQPQACCDPIVCGAAVVSAAQTIVSRSLPSSANVVVTIATFHAGERCNVIPDTATLSGTIRLVDEAVVPTVTRRFREIVESVSRGYKCTGEIKLFGAYPVLVNSVQGTEVVRRCAARLTGPVALEATEDGLPMGGSEDFSFYLQKRPGAFFFLGTQELLLRGLSAYEGAEDVPRSNCICHGTTYDFNDNVLPRAILMFLRIVEDRFALDLFTQEEVLDAAFSLVG